MPRALLVLLSLLVSAWAIAVPAGSARAAANTPYVILANVSVNMIDVEGPFQSDQHCFTSGATSQTMTPTGGPAQLGTGTPEVDYHWNRGAVPYARRHRHPVRLRRRGECLLPPGDGRRLPGRRLDDHHAAGVPVRGGLVVSAVLHRRSDRLRRHLVRRTGWRWQRVPLAVPRAQRLRRVGIGVAVRVARHAEPATAPGGPDAELRLAASRSSAMSPSPVAQRRSPRGGW